MIPADYARKQKGTSEYEYMFCSVVWGNCWPSSLHIQEVVTLGRRDHTTPTVLFFFFKRFVVMSSFQIKDIIVIILLP